MPLQRRPLFDMLLEHDVMLRRLVAVVVLVVGRLLLRNPADKSTSRAHNIVIKSDKRLIWDFLMKESLNLNYRFLMILWKMATVEAKPVVRGTEISSSN